MPIAKLVGNERLSIVTDHIGMPMAMVDHWGDRVWAAVLDSFGEIRAVEGDRCACPLRFQGQYEDAETELYYNRFRYYDREAGTYTAFDPIGLDGGLALRVLQGPNGPYQKKQVRILDENGKPITGWVNEK